MVIVMKDIGKKLSVLEIPCFAIHAILLQATSKVIINNFRGYFKMVVERASRIFSTFTTIHYVASVAMAVQWTKALLAT